MATERRDLETRLIATDNASKVIEHVADEAERLEKTGDIEIGLKADDKASDDIRELDRRLAGLSDEDKTIILRAQAKDAQRDIDRILRSLGQVDRMDDQEIQMRVEGLAKARADLETIETQLHRLDKETVDVEVDADTSGIRGKLAQLKTDLSGQTTTLGKLGTLGKTAFANLGTYAAEAGVAAGAAISAFVVKATTDFQNLALEVGKLRDTLGIPAEEASQLKEVVEDLGIPIEAFETAVVRMNKAAELTPGAFDDINAAVVRSDDGVLDVTETFLSVATALDAIPDAGERALAGAKIFGKGWTQIAELVEKGGLSIRAAMEQVVAAKIVDDEDIKNAKEMRDAVDDLRDRVEAFSDTIGREMVPALADGAEALGMFADVFTNFAKVATFDFGDIPLLNKLAASKYFGLIGTYRLLGDAIGVVKGEWDDWRGTVEGTVDPLMQAIAGTGDLNQQLEDLANKKDPLAAMTDQWKLLMDDMADGTIDTQAAADAANLLANYLGITTDEVLAIADAELDKQMQDAAAAADEYRQTVANIQTEVDGIQQGIEDWRDTVDEAKVSVAEMMDAFDAQRIDTVTTALGDFLAARQPGVQWLDTIADTKEAMRDLWKDIEDNEGTIPDIFATSTQAGRDFRDAIQGASDAVNQQLLQALENADGNFRKVREQADALRERMREKIILETGLSMDVPEEKEKIEGLLNAVVPTDEQVEVGIQLAKDDLAKLKADLSIQALQALLPATALQLNVDLATGEKSPEEAAATAQKIFRENDFDVDLGVSTKKADDDLVAFAKEERDTKMGVVVPDKELVGVAGTILAGPGGNGWPAIEVPVIPVLPPGYSGGSGGSIAPTPDRFGRAATTAMVPYTAPSARMAPVPVVINQNFSMNAGVMGDTWDLMRAVDQTVRRANRLLPVRP